jgi:alpha-amylase
LQSLPIKKRFCGDDDYSSFIAPRSCPAAERRIPMVRRRNSLALIVMILLTSTALLLTSTARAEVMMQGFYWDCPEDWYASYMQPKAAELRNMAGGYGINRMWFPPPSKGGSGGYSMGYDPTDYYDLGTYNQYGRVATRFGTQAQLKACITAYRNQGIACMADVVLNHRTGGASEWNPNTNSNTWTNFNGVLSGKCQWHYNQFHPSTAEGSDPDVFGGYPDVCHATGNVVGQPYKDLIDWGNWMKNTTNAGFNGGWRYDFVKGVNNWYIRDHRNNTGGLFCVGEYWDSNTATLDWWANDTGCSAFDFASYYTLRDICNNGSGGGHMPNLVDPNKSFARKNAWRAVTFCGNHDTDEIFQDKMIGYAYILTYQGYPCIWWKDYYNYGLATLGGQWGNGIKQLVWCREKLAGGGPNVRNLKTDDGDLLIYEDQDGTSSSPGYIVVLNDSATAWRGAWVNVVNSNLKNKTLKCYAWYSPVSGQNYQPANKTCDGNGWVEPWAPPRGYAVYAPTGY